MTQRATFMVCLAFSSMVHGAVQAAELGVFASRAVWTVLTAIGPEFEKNSGHKLNTTTGLSAEFVRRINSGEAFDVIAAPPGSLVGLIRGGKILPELADRNCPLEVRRRGARWSDEAGYRLGRKL